MFAGWTFATLFAGTTFTFVTSAFARRARGARLAGWAFVWLFRRRSCWFGWRFTFNSFDWRFAAAATVAAKTVPAATAGAVFGFAFGFFSTFGWFDAHRFTVKGAVFTTLWICFRFGFVTRRFRLFGFAFRTVGAATATAATATAAATGITVLFAIAFGLCFGFGFDVVFVSGLFDDFFFFGFIAEG